MPDSIRLALHPHFHLVWNLILALVPLVLSFYLFRRTDRRGWLWWPLLLVFVAFLPNAAYTSTDIIHFIDEVRDDNPLMPEWSVVYIIIPKYLLFMLLGFQCHVISLIRCGNYLRWVAHKAWVMPMEIVLNFLCAVGVYWGRYLRLNSWDVVSKPYALAQKAIDSLGAEMAALPILKYFVFITLAYYVLKWIDIAMYEHWELQHFHKRFPARVAAWTRRTPRPPINPPVEQERLQR
jgi:uncharacterized membrane protein